jgi:RHS repeat-associated protein
VRRADISGASNIYHIRARYYDAATARFLSPDPIWPQLDDSLELNPYAYAANDPMNNIDVNGADIIPPILQQVPEVIFGQYQGQPFIINDKERYAAQQANKAAMDEFARKMAAHDPSKKVQRMLQKTEKFFKPLASRPGVVRAAQIGGRALGAVGVTVAYGEIMFKLGKWQGAPAANAVKQSILERQAREKARALEAQRQADWRRLLEEAELQREQQKKWLAWKKMANEDLQDMWQRLQGRRDALLKDVRQWADPALGLWEGFGDWWLRRKPASPGMEQFMAGYWKDQGLLPPR